MKHTIRKAAFALTMSALVLSATSEMAVAMQTPPPTPPPTQPSGCGQDIVNATPPVPKSATITVMVQSNINSRLSASINWTALQGMT